MLNRDILGYQENSQKFAIRVRARLFAAVTVFLFVKLRAWYLIRRKDINDNSISYSSLNPNAGRAPPIPAGGDAGIAWCMAADAVIDVDRGVISRFREGLRGLSDDDLAAMARQSPAVHFASCVRIQNKDNDPIQPVPNILQLRMSEVYEVCMELGLPCRMVVCKPRQVGCSTFGALIVYHHGMRWQTAGITISDVAKNSRKMKLKVRGHGITAPTAER